MGVKNRTKRDNQKIEEEWAGTGLRQSEKIKRARELHVEGGKRDNEREENEIMRGSWTGRIGVLVAAERLKDWWLTQACKELRAAEAD